MDISDLGVGGLEVHISELGVGLELEVDISRLGHGRLEVYISELGVVKKSSS